MILLFTSKGSYVKINIIKILLTKGKTHERKHKEFID